MADNDKPENTNEPGMASPEVGRPAAPTVNWDDSEMRTAYANVVNAAATREEVTLFFGTNKTWNPKPGEQFEVKLEERVVLNPHAAKRLFVLLGAVLGQYEKNHGEIRLQGLEAATEMLRKARAAQQNGAGTH